MAVNYSFGSPEYSKTREIVEIKIYQNFDSILSNEKMEQIINTIPSKNETSVQDFVDILW